MPPTNDTGYDVAVGPDANGNYIHVPAGESYTAPTPPKSVTDSDGEQDDETAPVEVPEDTETPQPEPQPDPTPTKSGKQAATPEGD